MIEELFHPGDLLFNWRKKSWDRFQEMGLPTRKQEAFQYVSMKDFSLPEPAVESSSKPNRFLDECPYRCVFIDGFFSRELSQLPEKIVCLPLNEAMRSYGVFLQNRISKWMKEETDPFALLNGALQGKGAMLYIPPKFQFDAPLEVHHFLTTEKMSAPRLHIY